MPTDAPKPDEKKPEEPKAPAKESPKPPALAEWHAAFTKRHPVTLVKPKRVVKMTGYVSPEQRRDVLLPKAASVVAHRVLHSLAPTHHAELDKRFAASAEKDESGALDKWKLRFITQTIDLKSIGGAFALRKILAIHADPKKLAEHRAKVVAALTPEPSPAAAAKSAA